MMSDAVHRTYLLETLYYLNTYKTKKHGDRATLPF